MHNEDEMKRRGDEPVTKKDLWAHEAATRELQASTKRGFQAAAQDVQALGQRLDLRMDTFEAVMRRMAAALVRSQAKTDEKFYLIRRMDKVEDRVTRLERRA